MKKHSGRQVNLLILLIGIGITQAKEDSGNLQVLPLHLSRAEVLEVMRLMTLGLGTDCQLCHRSERNDYLSDELVPKKVARGMMRMVEASTAGLDWTRPPQNLCSGCHKGSLKIP